jgi:hypothetical protein
MWVGGLFGAAVADEEFPSPLRRRAGAPSAISRTCSLTFNDQAVSVSSRVMEYRKLGKTGWNVSVIGYGAAPLGGVYGKLNEKEGIRSVHTAIELGINFIDTAPYYGATRIMIRIKTKNRVQRRVIYTLNLYTTTRLHAALPRSNPCWRASPATDDGQAAVLCAKAPKNDCLVNSRLRSQIIFRSNGGSPHDHNEKVCNQLEITFF